jgi:hypothetical protein
MVILRNRENIPGMPERIACAVLELVYTLKRHETATYVAVEVQFDPGRLLQKH